MKEMEYRKRLENEIKFRNTDSEKQLVYLREIAINLYGILQELKKRE